jgi:transcriptional regulator GlxA family with amidase domain
VARTAVHRIGIVVFDGVKLLDVAGPSEVFSEANRMGARYELTLCAVGGRPVSSSTGMTIPADADATGPQLCFDTLLVTGGDVSQPTPSTRSCARPSRALRHGRAGSARSAPGPSFSPRPGCSTAAAPSRTGVTPES